VEVFCVACASEEHSVSIFRMTLNIETALPQGEDSQKRIYEYLTLVTEKLQTSHRHNVCSCRLVKNILNTLLFSDDLDTDKRILLK
jgi:hypothetical protein